MREVAGTLGISIEWVQDISTHLDLEKLFAKWMPPLLANDNKYTSVYSSTE